jgi:hypothetical protein
VKAAATKAEAEEKNEILIKTSINIHTERMGN